VAIDRAEQTGLGIAVIGHLALFAALSLSLLNAPPLPVLESEPVEVELVTDIAPVTSAPDPQPLAPAPALAPEPAPPVDAAPPEPAPLPPTPKPLPPQPRPPLPKPVPPAPKPVPKPTPRAVPKPAPKPAPSPKPAPRAVAKLTPKPAAKPATARPAAKPEAKPARDVRPTGNLAGILTGSASRPGPSPSPKPQAAVAGPSAADLATIKRALGTEIGRQLKPKWKAPTGADVDQLVTILSWDLTSDGNLSGAPRFISQGGVTPSNQAQAAIHRDNAIKAVRAAAPFNLPSQHYSLWKSVISFKFDKRLSQ
jgi:outer membrane biosynthesis protein TonB